MKGKIIAAKEIRRRDWRAMNLRRLQQGAKSIQWADFYRIKDINLANDWFQEKICGLLDAEAPWKISQPRRNYKNWVTAETKELMKLRNETRESARIYKCKEPWNLYNKIKNLCNRKVKEDRNNYFLKRFQNMEENNDLKGTNKLLKTQAGWATGGTPSSFLLDGKLETSPRKLAETQMNFFFKQNPTTIK